MPHIWIAVLVIIAATIGGLAVTGGRMLLSWYLREVRAADVAADPAEAIVTYPLA